MQITDIFKLLGGVGLFLFGMSIMSTGLKNACGDNLQNILECATKNKVVAVFAGLLMTVLVQSSSAIDVMVIGFVNSGMMNLSQAIGVIMGANIGTTITAQITAFNLAFTHRSFFCRSGYVSFFKNQSSHIGSIIMGFGMLFAGITMIKEVVGPLSDSDEFISFISTLNNPALAVAFGVGFTALLQSSSSSIVIFQTFAVQGILTYNTAVYLVIGAAIGSVTPNLLAGLTANREGKRTAVLNLLFNLIRAILLITLINVIPLTDWICRLSPNDVGRQIANTHTIFAVIAVLVELPFTKFIIRLAEKIIPVNPEENKTRSDRSLVYMNQLDNIPVSVALHQTQREICRMGRIAANNLNNAIKCFFDYNAEKAADVRNNEETVNILNHSIADAMLQLKTLDLTTENMRRVSMMTIAVTDIERLSDHAENIVEYIEEMNSKRLLCPSLPWTSLSQWLKIQ